MESDEENNPTGNIIAIVFGLLTILLLVCTQVESEQESTLLAQSSHKACGVISDYYLTSDAQRVVRYTYRVNGRTYWDQTYEAFEGCEDTRACIGKRFLVQYATDKPEVNRAWLAYECP